MDFINKIIEKIDNTQLLVSIIVIIISFVLYKAISIILIKGEEDGFKIFTSSKSKTYLRMFKSINRFIFVILTILVLLQVNGVNVGSMLAGIGIVGVVIGFAVQDILKDFLGGISIIYDSYFQIGDVIKYNSIEGKVIALGIKTTKIKDIKTQNIISISNRNINQIEVVSNLINLDIPMPHEVRIEKAEEVISDILLKLKEIKRIKKCEYRNVSEIDDWCIKYRICVFCDPIYKLQITRDVQRLVLLTYSEHNIEVPKKQIDIHNKEDKKIK